MKRDNKEQIQRDKRQLRDKIHKLNAKELRMYKELENYEKRGHELDRLAVQMSNIRNYQNKCRDEDECVCQDDYGVSCTNPDDDLCKCKDENDNKCKPKQCIYKDENGKEMANDPVCNKQSFVDPTDDDNITVYSQDNPA